MTIRTLQIGMEWFPESPGGLNRVYARLIFELGKLDVEVNGLVAGTAAVARETAGIVRAFAPHDASLLTRMRALRLEAMPFLRENARGSVIVSHFAPYALPLLDYLVRRPFVVHFHGPWGLESRVEGASQISAAVREQCERLVYQRADAAIVLSDAFREILVDRFGVSRNRIHVIPGGVEAQRFALQATRLQCRRDLGWPVDRPLVLCVRRLVRRVGLDVLIDSTVELRRSVPDVLVVVVGTGPLRAELQARISEKGLDHFVRLVGFIEDEKLPSAYRAADLTVVPTVALEGFGLITAESLAAGTPCVVTPVDALAEIIEPLAPQLISPSAKAADLAHTMVSALTGRITLPTAGECAAYARERFDWPVVAAKVKRVYEQVAS